MLEVLSGFLASCYRYMIRPILFRFSSEKVHHVLVSFGAGLGRIGIGRGPLTAVFRPRSPLLRQTVAGIDFAGPIGLAAGFDYRAQLPEVLPALGFGFGSVGTFTLQPCHGNPAPQLGRLVRSRSLLVNKGFKNEGIDALIRQSVGRTFTIPAGLSIGRTNAPMTEQEAIKDICQAFAGAEAARLPYAYYELNISCPNLVGHVSFYEPPAFERLLAALEPSRLSRPVFLKMPIELTDDQTLAIVDSAIKYGISTVIIGNLQKNRHDPAIDRSEVAKVGAGNFSGKPTWDRSNQLIGHIYRERGAEVTIIGCGGTFSADDAYTKIRLGSTLVQLITGLVYVGPQLPAQINYGLVRRLQRDGFTNIAEAVGVDSRS